MCSFLQAWISGLNGYFAGHVVVRVTAVLKLTITHFDVVAECVEKFRDDDVIARLVRILALFYLQQPPSVAGARKRYTSGCCNADVSVGLSSCSRLSTSLRWRVVLPTCEVMDPSSMPSATLKRDLWL